MVQKPFSQLKIGKIASNVALLVVHKLRYPLEVGGLTKYKISIVNYTYKHRLLLELLPKYIYRWVGGQKE